MVQAQVYCPHEVMTPEFAERAAFVVEQITGLTFSHSIRDAFPSARRMSIAGEAAAAWNSPRRRFRISNAQTNPEHIQLTAGIMPRRTDTGREHYGYVGLAFKAGASAAEAVANDLARLVSECHGIYARADAPRWGAGAGNPEAFGTVELPVAPGWLLSERIGWSTFLPLCVCSLIGADARQAMAAMGVQITRVDGGETLRLSVLPLDDARPEDLGLYQAVRERLRACVASPSR